MNCPFCASANVRRSRRRGIAEKVTCWLGKWPYRCHTCMHRFFSPERHVGKARRRSGGTGKRQVQPQVIEGTIVDS
jgi:hypothetical protein